MWSAHDVAHHHHRRYRKQEFRSSPQRRLLDRAVSPFNSLLFPIRCASRLGKITGKDDSDTPCRRVVNKLLDTIFGLERGLIGRVPMPFGVSLVAVLRRPR